MHGTAYLQSCMILVVLPGLLFLLKAQTSRFLLLKY